MALRQVFLIKKSRDVIFFAFELVQKLVKFYVSFRTRFIITCLTTLCCIEENEVKEISVRP